jgi:hypothetical protein
MTKVGFGSGGAAIGIDGGTLHVESSSFMSNNGAGAGGAISLAYANVTVIGSTFTNSTGYPGNDIYIDDESDGHRYV